MSTAAVSFARYLLDHEAKRPELGVEFCHLMLQLAFAAKIIAREITRAALINRLGLVGTQNATGDAQKILDVFTNDTMTRAFARTGLVAEIISEEMVEPKRVPAVVGWAKVSAAFTSSRPNCKAAHHPHFASRL